MLKNDVTDASKALAYITDCTLATVAELRMKKSAGRHETARQISIAQQGLDWMNAFGVAFKGTRTEAVNNDFAGSVEAWASQFKP